MRYHRNHGRGNSVSLRPLWPHGRATARPGWLGRGMWFPRRAPAVARIAPLAGM